MLDELYRLEKKLPKLLRQPEIWNALLIDYRPPKVERLWTQIGDLRLYLHCIWPCTAEEAFFHPHPWASAVKIYKGGYMMGVGYGRGIKLPPVSHTIWLGPDSSYEMVNRDAWHYVQPLKRPSYSFMITRPWQRKRKMPDVPAEPLSALAPRRARDLRFLFQRLVEK